MRPRHRSSSSSSFGSLIRRAAPLSGLLALLALALSALAGCGSTAGGSGGTITFGAPVSLTGSTSHEGTDTLNGYTLWADTVNAKGGLTVGGKTYQIKIQHYDDASDPTKSKQLTQQLVTSDKVNFLLGPYGTSPTLTDETVAKQFKIPMVEGNGAATSIFNQDNPYIFGVLSPAPKYGQTMIDAATSVSSPPKTIAIISANDSFSTEVAKAAASYASTKGLTLVAPPIFYPNGATDLTSVLNQLKALPGGVPDVVLGSGHEAEAETTLKQAQQLGVTPKLWGFTVGPALPDFISTMGTLANGVMSSSQWTPQVKYTANTPADPWQTASAFEQAYKAKYNEEPSYQAAESAACGVTYAAALQSAGSLDPQKVRDALSSLNIVTFYGPIVFDLAGSNTTKPMVTTQIQSGQLFTVYPSTVANGSLKYPGA